MQRTPELDPGEVVIGPPNDTQAPASQITSPVDKLADLAGRAASAVGAVALVLMMLHIMADVVARNVLNDPLEGTMEITQYWWMPVCGLAGLALAQSRGEHIAVDVLPEAAGRVAATVSRVVTNFVSLAVLGWVLTVVWETAVARTELSEKAVGQDWLVIWPVRWVIVALFVLYVVANVATLLRAFKRSQEANDD